MYRTEPGPSLRQRLATIGFVWVAASLAGMLPGLFSRNAVAQAASLGIYTVLLAAYARWTEAGRRSSGAYFLAGLLLPIACFALLVLLPLPADPASFLWSGFEAIFAGLDIGFQAHGGPDTPLEFYLPLMWLNLLLPIAAVVGGRSFVRYHRSD